MFRIECFCKDEKLGDTMKVLAQAKAMNVVPTWVPNAEPSKNGEIKAKLNGTSSIELVLSDMAKKKQREFVHSDVRRTLEDLGYSSKSAGSMIDRMMKQGLVKRGGKSASSPNGHKYIIQGEK